MEDLIAWEADPLAFKVIALAGDDGYGVKDTDDGGDNDGITLNMRMMVTMELP